MKLKQNRMIKTDKTDPTKAIDLRKLLHKVNKKGWFNPLNIRCQECGRRLDVNSENYIAVWGNITAGLFSGLVGNNFDENGELFRLAFYCNDAKCFGSILPRKK